jgi:hypothetical protein
VVKLYIVRGTFLRMARVLFHSFLLLALLGCPSGQSLLAQRSTPPERHWRETESETLWMGRYKNCDYEYYVTLDAGVIGHGTHSPNPNHGFLVSLVDPGKNSLATYETEERYIWVDASYNSTDHRTLRRIAQDQLQIPVWDKSGSHRIAVKLGGLPAIQSWIEISSVKGEVFEEQIITLRSGIIYTIGLKTLSANRSQDAVLFQRIVDGFRLLSLPQGECSND